MWCYLCGNKLICDEYSSIPGPCFACYPTTNWTSEVEADAAYERDLGKHRESPFAVLVDNREQRPYCFQGIMSDANKGRQPLVVRRRPCTLGSGDYSIDGYADCVCVERKSYTDLAGTLTSGRKRFIRELERMSKMPVSWVVCEVTLDTMKRSGPANSRIVAKTLWRSAWAFQCQFPNVHWEWHDGRDDAEVATYRILEKWWQEFAVKPGKAKAVRRSFTPE